MADSAGAPEVPEVSVVLPVHDVGPWLAECLSSLLDDQDVALEVIAVDDHSADESRAILDRRAATDPRLRVVDNPGSGGAAARNAGAVLARGEFVAFADGDDLVPRGAYRAMLDSLRASGSQMAIGRFLKFFPTRTWTPTDAWTAFDEPRRGIRLTDQPTLVRNRACWNRLFRRDFWLTCGIEFPSVPRSNDIVPMVRALVAADSIDVVDQMVYLYRSRPGTGSMTAGSKALDSWLSYIGQEAETLALTSALGDAALRAEHEDLVVNQDGWVHLQKFLADQAGLALDEVGLTRARDAFATVWDGLLPASRDSVGDEVALVYDAFLAGRWSPAIRAASALASGGREVGVRLPELLDTLADIPDAEERRAVASAALVRSLAVAELPLAPEQAQLDRIDLAVERHRDDLLGWWPRSAWPTLPLAFRALLVAVERGTREDVELLFAQRPPRLTIRSLRLEDGVLRAGLRWRGIDPTSLGFLLRSGDRVLDLPAPVPAADAVGTLLDVPLEARGEWELRARVLLSGEQVEVPFRLAPEAASHFDDGRRLVTTSSGDAHHGARLHVERLGAGVRLRRRLRNLLHS